jgi:hypothetical protein
VSGSGNDRTGTRVSFSGLLVLPDGVDKLGRRKPRSASGVDEQHFPSQLFSPNCFLVNLGDAMIGGHLLNFLVPAHSIHMQRPQLDGEGWSTEPWRRNVALGAAVADFQTHGPLPGGLSALLSSPR